MAATHPIGGFRASRAAALAFACTLLAVTSLAIGAAAFAQAPVYRFTPPAGWARSEQAGAIAFMPASEPAGSVVLMILPLAARSPDLDGQFTALRTAFEGSLGLRDQREAQQQRSAGSGFETRVHYAEYSSNAGDRYFAILGRAEASVLGTVLFIATNAEAYNRLRGAAAELFNGLRIVADGATQPSPATVLPAPANLAAPGGTAVSANRPAAEASGAGNTASGGPSVWMALKILFGPYSSGEHPRWMTIFADGEILDDIPAEGLAAFDRASAHADPGLHWGALRGAEIFKAGVQFPIKVTPIDAGKMKLDSDTYYRSQSVDGLRLDGVWTSYANANDPALERLPIGQRPLFRFSRDGRFSDEGVFVTTLRAANQSDPGYARPGQGRYEIAAYTLVLRYDDGRVKRLAITALLGGDPSTQDSVLYISRTRFNKRR